MTYRYQTRGIVLSRSPAGEANAIVTLMTPELGVVRARAQGIRRPGAKLAAALATFAESSLVLVRGKEDWRIAGAVFEENWFTLMDRPRARAAAARMCGLLLRLVAGEAHIPDLFIIVRNFFEALSALSEEECESAEVLAALRLLAALGLYAGEIPGGVSEFSSAAYAEILKNRASYVAHVNNGIAASGL